MDESAMEALGKPTARRAPDQAPIEYAQEQELHEKLRQAVAELSDKHQIVFILHTSEDLSYKEIAEVVAKFVTREQFLDKYSDVFKGSLQWRAVKSG